MQSWSDEHTRSVQGNQGCTYSWPSNDKLKKTDLKQFCLYFFKYWRYNIRLISLLSLLLLLKCFSLIVLANAGWQCREFAFVLLIVSSRRDMCWACARQTLSSPLREAWSSGYKQRKQGFAGTVRKAATQVSLSFCFCLSLILTGW